MRRSVLLIHGGGWANGDRSQLRGYGIGLGRRGFVCVAGEYRLSGEAHWPAQLHDVKAALRFMRSEHEALGLDPDKISVSGNSAGAHLALMVAGTPNHARFEGEGGNPGLATDCAAAIAIYPPTSLGGGEKMLGGPIAALFGPNADAADVLEASPLAHAKNAKSADFPPTQLIHGNRDTTVPSEQSLEMYRALEAAGAPVELHLFNGAGHAFDTERDLGRACTELMALFLDRHVPA